MSCNDQSKPNKEGKKTCDIVVDGKAVGGYAETYKGRLGWYTYHSIVFCPVFFLADDLEHKINEIESDIAKGNPKTSQLAEWQKNQGQMFLHEMMHLDSVGKPHNNYHHSPSLIVANMLQS